MRGKGKDGENNASVSIFDILSIVENSENELSSEDLSKAITKLQAVKRRAEKRERLEQNLREQVGNIEQKKRESEEKSKRAQRGAAHSKEERESVENEAKAAVESHIEQVTRMDLPLDWDNIFNSDVRTQGVHVDSIADGLILSLTELGRVDIEYISSITAQSYKTVISALKGSIFQNPEKWDECFYKGWETSEEYLSGNLMRKLRIAVEANDKYNGYFKENVKAIEKVLPNMVSSGEIYVTLGSPWVPAYVIDDFVTHILGLRNRRYEGTMHDEITGTWELPFKSYYKGSVRSESTYGTQRMQALYILERTLNMKSVAVKDEVSCTTNASGKKRVVNEAETVSALEKQAKMIKEFQRWVWQDETRKSKLEEIFQSRYGCIRRRIFDGSFLKFPTMSNTVQLYPYQKDAVARILFSPNTLLAHDVGSGKTYVMIAAGMELMRMGLSKKNLYVVPNNIVGQWKSIFNVMYPQAKLLVVEPKLFTPSKREAMLKTIKNGSYDGIIMAYSCFEQIPISKEYYRKELLDQRAVIESSIRNQKMVMTQQSKKRASIDKALHDLNNAIDDAYDRVYFDELGVTRLFVDEAHNFKNVPLETKVSNVLGINSAGSKKCKDMLDKVHIVQKLNGGGGVVMATGTPITNSITDAYIMQQYLQSGELAMLDLQSFDSWIGMFAERRTEFEIDVDTSGYRLATRFARFHNLPELTAILSSIADFHQLDKSAGIPEVDGYHDALVSKTAEFERFLEDISARADAVRHGIVSRKEDNMLKITTDGRKAALDFRLVDGKATFTQQSKVARCAENVADIYFKTYRDKSTQLVFCDTSTPKAEFNLYDEMKRLLVNMGIPEDTIAYIHSAETDSQRMKLFSRVNNGDVRILIGSTFKLGLGVNVQKRLIALHHLDVPWRPADMTQREGRIMRQGNLNSKVNIYRYITEGSFDAYSWQLLETKARFIADLLSGAITTRSGADVDDTVLSYAEVKALAIGNPLVKRRVEVANELSRYMTLQRKTVENRMRLENELMELPARIRHQTELIEYCERDMAFYEERKNAQPKEISPERKKENADKRKVLRERLHAAVMDNVLEVNERPLLIYRGFTVVLPANMLIEKPYVYLKREGKYYVELGDTEAGNLQRLTNFLDTLDKHLEKLKNGLAVYEERRQGINVELAKDENYVEQIKACKDELMKIDKKLKAVKK